jgi:hypothetical protein
MSIGKRLLGMAATLIGTVGLLAVSSPAEAQRAAVPVGHVLRAGAVVVPVANGGTAGWASISYLRAHPDAIPGVHVSMAGSGDVRPASASGCNQNVCIAITGDGLFVSNWTTTAYGNVGCTYAAFHSQMFTVYGRWICATGSGPGVYYDTTGPIGYYQDDEEVCNSWLDIRGYPCETIG